MSKSADKNSEGWKRFRQWVALNRVSVGRSAEKLWKYYDFGCNESFPGLYFCLTFFFFARPKDSVPLVCIPGVTGTAEVFYKLMLSLCPKGYRIISVQAPPYMTHKQWCKGFDRFLDSIRVDKVSTAIIYLDLLAYSSP